MTTGQFTTILALLAAAIILDIVLAIQATRAIRRAEDAEAIATQAITDVIGLRRELGR